MTPQRAGSRPGSTAQRVPLSPVGSRRVEETLARMMSVFGVLFTLQSVPLLVEGWPSTGSPLGLALVVGVYGAVAVAGLAGLLHQWVRVVFWGVGVVYAAALLLWPLSVTGPWTSDRMPWIVVVAGVPCGMIVMASRGPVPIVSVVGIAAMVGWLRTTPSAGSATPVQAVQSGGYVLVLALATLLVVTAVRRAARAVDVAQGAALGRYADAQTDEATEAERTRTDALVHDSVLTTFLSAASAQTPEAQALAARMAQNAMNVLSRATVASHTGPKVAAADLLERVRRDAAGVGDRFDFRVSRVGGVTLPDPVADAVVSATVQAMTNSVKHAGGPEIPRRLLIEGTETGGVRVSIVDRGRGFDPAAVASERLGLRVSILERMQRVGGEVELTTAPGEGTEFVLSWPASARSTAGPATRVQAVSA